MHASGDVAVPVGEQVTVGPKGHAEVGVAELPLHHQGVGSLGDHQRDTRVPQRVAGDSDEAGFSHRRSPEASHEVS